MAKNAKNSRRADPSFDDLLNRGNLNVEFLASYLKTISSVNLSVLDLLIAKETGRRASDGN